MSMTFGFPITTVPQRLPTAYLHDNVENRLPSLQAGRGRGWVGNLPSKKKGHTNVSWCGLLNGFPLSWG